MTANFTFTFLVLFASYIWPYTNVDHSIIRGYGDYNYHASYHPGIDIAEPVNDASNNQSVSLSLTILIVP